MRLIFITFIILSLTPLVQAKEIKLNKSNAYHKAAIKNAIISNPKPQLTKQKINNVHPIIIPKQPTLNGNFSQRLAYKNSQQTIKTRQRDDQLQLN